MQEIKGDRIYHAFMVGAKEVMSGRDHLNEINVFPVPDGDTGNNLNSMMQSILLHAENKSSLKETMESISTSAIRGARGNSGVIFSQYIHGLTTVEDTPNTITPEYLIDATRRGYIHAYDAVEMPVEGTILTTMRVFHEALKSNYQRKISFMELLDKTYLTVEETVLETKYQLKKLKEASVVDSGAKGFALFVKGFIQGLKDNTSEIYASDSLQVEEQIILNHGSIELDSPPSYRYCTEALIEGHLEDKAHIEKYLKSLGDSIAISSGKKLTRIHLHTDYPHQVFKGLSIEHKVLEQKVDDMKSQYDLIHNRLYQTVVVTDSSADLPKEWLDKGQVVVFPLELLIDDTTYKDKLTIDNERLFELMEETGGYPTSSQPNILEVTSKIENLLTYYEDMVVITVSKALSGTYNTFKKASEAFGDRVQLIDSKQNSIGQGLLVMKAVELLESGKVAKEIAISINKQVKDSKILVSVATLNSMVASGRLNVKIARIADMMGLYPVVTLDENGEGAIEKIFWRDKNKLSKLLKYLEEIHYSQPIESFAVTYVNDQQVAKRFAVDLEKVLGMKCRYVVECSSVIAAGAGKGAVAVAYIRK